MSGTSPTIKDIATRLGISHATVSRALNDSHLVTEETKRRVRAAANAMGYLPDITAQVMRGARANTIGFVLPDVENHFYSAVARAIAQTVASAGMQLILAISEDDPELELRHVRELIQARAGGIIITPGPGLKQRTAELLAQVACVQLVRRHPAISADVISADDRNATYLSTRHLLDLGHRHIVYVGGGPETLSTGQERAAGYSRALEETSDARGELILTSPRDDFGRDIFRDVLRRSDRPTGLVLGSSQFTLGALGAIRERDFEVGRDIALIAYDDPDWYEHWGPGISTIALPIRDMANYAAAQVCRAPLVLDTNPTIVDLPGAMAKHVSFPVRLMARGTCHQPAAFTTKS